MGATTWWSFLLVLCSGVRAGCHVDTPFGPEPEDIHLKMCPVVVMVQPGVVCPLCGMFSGGELPLINLTVQFLLDECG